MGTTFAPNQVIRGWTEAMQLMVEGDKWEMYIPHELAYGVSGSPPKIPGESALVFQMEIVSVNGAGRKRIMCNVETNDACNDAEKEYIGKMKRRTAEKLTTELARLGKMASENGQMSPDQKQWVATRIVLLNALVGVQEKKVDL